MGSLGMDLSSDEEIPLCPLCLEELDATDLAVKACRCGYQVCLYCLNTIREQHNGKCPACRTPYEEDKFEVTEVDRDKAAKIARERAEAKRERERRSRKRELERERERAAMASEQRARMNLKHARVVQRNLVYVIGLSLNLAREETLKRNEIFGRFGRILFILVNRTTTYNPDAPGGPSMSAYVQFARDSDASQAVRSMNGEVFDGRELRLAIATTKYCDAFVKTGTPTHCGNTNCLNLHEPAPPEDVLTREEVISNQLGPPPPEHLFHSLRRERGNIVINSGYGRSTTISSPAAGGSPVHTAMGAGGGTVMGSYSLSNGGPFVTERSSPNLSAKVHSHYSREGGHADGERDRRLETPHVVEVQQNVRRSPEPIRSGGEAHPPGMAGDSGRAPSIWSSGGVTRSRFGHANSAVREDGRTPAPGFNTNQRQPVVRQMGIPQTAQNAYGSGMQGPPALQQQPGHGPLGYQQIASPEEAWASNAGPPGIPGVGMSPAFDGENQKAEVPGESKDELNDVLQRLGKMLGIEDTLASGEVWSAPPTHEQQPATPHVFNPDRGQSRFGFAQASLATEVAEMDGFSFSGGSSNGEAVLRYAAGGRGFSESMYAKASAPSKSSAGYDAGSAYPQAQPTHAHQETAHSTGPMPPPPPGFGIEIDPASLLRMAEKEERKDRAKALAVQSQQQPKQHQGVRLEGTQENYSGIPSVAAAQSEAKHSVPLTNGIFKDNGLEQRKLAASIEKSVATSKGSSSAPRSQPANPTPAEIPAPSQPSKKQMADRAQAKSNTERAVPESAPGAKAVATRKARTSSEDEAVESGKVKSVSELEREVEAARAREAVLQNRLAELQQRIRSYDSINI